MPTPDWITASVVPVGRTKEGRRMNEPKLCRMTVIEGVSIEEVGQVLGDAVHIEHRDTRPPSLEVWYWDVEA